jgi:hypothetical protein
MGGGVGRINNVNRVNAANSTRKLHRSNAYRRINWRINDNGSKKGTNNASNGRNKGANKGTNNASNGTNALVSANVRVVPAGSNYVKASRPSTNYSSMRNRTRNIRRYSIESNSVVPFSPARSHIPSYTRAVAPSYERMPVYSLNKRLSINGSVMPSIQIMK